MTTYRPGSFFLTTISGPAGFAVGVGQALAGSPSRYEHAGIIVSVDGQTVEAEPAGARFGHIADYAGRAVLVSDGPVQGYLGSQAWLDPSDRPFLELSMRNAVVAEAHSVVGLGYSPLDYVAIALVHLELLLTGRPRPTWWITGFARRRVQRSGRMICSQLVDAVYERTGIHLFDDDRLPGDVMPADLAAWAEDQATVGAR